MFKREKWALSEEALIIDRSHTGAEQIPGFSKVPCPGAGGKEEETSHKTPGMTVMDLLLWISKHTDGSYTVPAARQQ